MRDLESQLGSLTDKFSLGYFPVYRDLLAGIPGASILDVGVAGGGSLRLWQALSPESVIVGVDHADNAGAWPEGVVKVIADQSDPELLATLADYAPFDVIIDDASHVGSLSTATFALLWPLVRPGGWYVLEDWPVGLESSPYYPLYEGDSMLQLARSFVNRIQPEADLKDMGGMNIPGGPVGSIDEVRYRYGLALVHKNARTT